MGNGLPGYWKQFNDCAMARAKQNGIDLKEIEKSAKKIVKSITEKGYVKSVLKEALLVDDAVFSLVYQQLANKEGTDGTVPSPILDRKNANWMSDDDFCFFNARATGIEFESTGSFIQSIKILPSIRPNNIHLAPFFDCLFDNLYAMDSLRVITDGCVDLEYEKEGLKRTDQLRIFIDAAHLLQKTVGFDLEPHTSQFSRVVLENPTLFRWIKLSEDKRKLADNMEQEEMLKPGYQKSITDEVTEVVKKKLGQYKLKSVEDPDARISDIRDAHFDITMELISRGLWTIPSHTWGGAGLPRFLEYNFTDNYPRFEYRDPEGEDHEMHAFGMLTPFKFYDNLPMNEVPTMDNPPVLYQETLDFFYQVFPNIQKEYGFDFVRLDFVDHVFDAIVDERDDVPSADRLIPCVIEKTMKESIKAIPSTGRTAERMGTDIDQYGRIGFNQVLGINVLDSISRGMFELDMENHKRVATLNSMRKEKISIQNAVDTHDTGNPLFYGESLSDIIGSKGMQLRFFSARFTSCGPGARPLYECIGNQDLSGGLYVGNNIPRSLTWASDKKFNNFYHNLYDTWNRFGNITDNGEVDSWHAEDNYAWWFLSTPGISERLLCVMYLEKKLKSMAEAKTRKVSYKPVQGLEIKVCDAHYSPNVTVSEIDLATLQEKKMPVQDSGRVVIDSLSPLAYKLFHIKY
jgi:hypothetical protein